MELKQLKSAFRSLFDVKSVLVAVNKGLPVGLHHLEDLAPHCAVLGQDPGVVCGQGNGPLAAVIDSMTVLTVDTRSLTWI